MAYSWLAEAEKLRHTGTLMPLAVSTAPTSGSHLLRGSGALHVPHRDPGRLRSNISRHADAHHLPPSLVRVRDHRVRHLLLHALHRVLPSLVGRETVIQTVR